MVALARYKVLTQFDFLS